MMAMAVCATMPAAAAVPIEVGVIAQPLTAKEYAAPTVAIVNQDVAALSAEAPAITAPSAPGRSSGGASRAFVAPSTFTPAPYQHIDPDIAG